MPGPRLPNELNDKYRILAQLGEGGTAHVWLAMARGPGGFNKLVVLKTVRTELFDNDRVMDMFMEEAKLAARLNHSNIVQTNEVFRVGRQPVIVMEYLDGLPFSVILERQREGSALALAMLLRAVSDGLAGLHAAHELRDYDGTDLRVVHRDVSPHNLFVTFSGEVKVLDFGIAKLTTSTEQTETGVIKGKLRYIAPEQISGEHRVDRRADLYSMGVVLWEVAAARRMWTGMTDAKIVQRIVSGHVPDLRRVNPDVDVQLVQIIDCALTRDPDRRFPSALAFQNALDAYVSTLGAPLRNRDLGRALSKMFEDVREERKRTIDDQLARVRADSLLDVERSRGTVPELTSFSNVHGALRARHRRGKFDKVLVFATVAAMLLFVLALLLWPEDPKFPEIRETLAPPPLETQMAPREKVRVRITAFPSHARLILDGQPLPSNPHTRSYPRDDTETHRLEVRADGYQSYSQSILLSHNQDVVVNLIRGPATSVPGVESKPLRPRTPRPIAQPSPAPSAQPPASDPRPAESDTAPPCNPPYYYDDRGVKKYRPQCL